MTVDGMTNVYNRIAPRVRKIVWTKFRGHPDLDDLVMIADAKVKALITDGKVDPVRFSEAQQIAYCAKAAVRAVLTEISGPRYRSLDPAGVPQHPTRKSPTSAIMSVRVQSHAHRAIRYIAESKAISVTEWLREAIHHKISHDLEAVAQYVGAEQKDLLRRTGRSDAREHPQTHPQQDRCSTKL